MVSHTLGKIKLFGSLTLAATLTLLAFNPVMADGEVTLRATVDEMLTVSLEQTMTSTLESDSLVRNKVGLIVTTNNPGGFTASMTTADAEGTLKHSTNNNLTIPVLSSNTTRGQFDSNAWGFSVDDTAVGDTGSHYKTIATLGATSPSFITSTSSGGSTKDIYFGAKATAAGSYSNSVIISVVSGVDTTEPTTPDDPVNPSDDPTPNDNNGEYISNRGDSTSGATVGRVTTSTGTTSKTVTQMTKGDTTSSYTDPQGVTNTIASINEGTPLATGLAVTAAVAATTGVFFFVLAKRRKDDDDEDADY